MPQAQSVTCRYRWLIAIIIALNIASLVILQRNVNHRASHHAYPFCTQKAANRNRSQMRVGATKDTVKLHYTADRNFTIVTAYFNLGIIRKGKVTNLRGPQDYMQWMWPYKYVSNGVVAYFDDSNDAAAFRDLRGSQLTKIVIVKRSDLWAFSMLTATERIFAQPDYPKDFPKSTSAEYVGVMHAKYELLARVVQENPFGSRYFAWMDMGVYRELPINATSEFMLRAPKCLCDDFIMFGRVHELADTTTENVMRNGIDWVAGGLYLARADTMLDFCDDYRRHTELHLSKGLANHDQSVICSMYLPGVQPRPVVPVQTVRASIPEDPFFFLALQLRRLALAGTEPDGSCLQTRLFT